MKFFKFLAWWWNKQSYGDKWWTAFTGNVLTVIPLCLIFGAKGLLILLCLLLTFCVIGLSTAIYLQVRKTWHRYNEEMEQEAQEIVERLSGRHISNW